MRFLILALCTIAPAGLWGQESVCDLFKDLKAADGRLMTLTGDLIVSKNVAVLGVTDCDNEFVVDHMQYAVALDLVLTKLSSSDSARFQEAVAKAEEWRAQGKPFTSTAVLSGRVSIHPQDLAADFELDDLNTT